MKNLIFIIFSLLIAGCMCDRKPVQTYPVWVDGDSRCINTTDSTFRIMGASDNGMGQDTGWVYIHPGDTFPPYHPWSYPDTITVAFTRNGKFEDSIQVIAWRVPHDSLDDAYVLMSAYGDVWTYNLKGKFCRFLTGPNTPASYKNKYRP